MIRARDVRGRGCVTRPQLHYIAVRRGGADLRSLSVRGRPLQHRWRRRRREHAARPAVHNTTLTAATGSSQKCARSSQVFLVRGVELHQKWRRPTRSDADVVVKWTDVGEVWVQTKRAGPA